MMATVDVNESTTNWKSKALNWLFSQGVSTVLLFAILGGVYRGVPLWISQQTEATAIQRRDFTETLDIQRENFEKILVEQRHDHKEAVASMVDQFTRTVERMEQQRKN